MVKQRICANGKSMSPNIIGEYCDLTTALPTNRLFEVHDSLVLALDATGGSVIPYRNVAEGPTCGPLWPISPSPSHIVNKRPRRDVQPERGQ